MNCVISMVNYLSSNRKFYLCYLKNDTLNCLKISNKNM